MNRVIIQKNDDNKHDDNGPMDQIKSNLYLKIFILLFLLIVIILLHYFYFFIIWFIHRVYFNNSPVLVVCHRRCCLFSFFTDSKLHNYIVLYFTASTHNNLNRLFGTVPVGGKSDNRFCMIHGTQVYRYNLMWKF